MDTAILIPAVMTAATVGLGCGACCSPAISVFLTSYVVSHGKGMGNGVMAFAGFFLGKICSVALLCIAAAGIGRPFIGADGYIGTFPFRVFMRLVMSGIGISLIVRWILTKIKEGKLVENKPSEGRPSESKRTEKELTGTQSGCHGCTACGSRIPKKLTGILPTFLAGAAYGATPCTPLLMMMGYTFTLPLPIAAAAGGIFGLSSAAGPILAVAVLSGILSGRMAHEIPEYLKWFQLASYVFLAAMPFVWILFPPELVG